MIRFLVLSVIVLGLALMTCANEARAFFGFFGPRIQINNFNAPPPIVARAPQVQINNFGRSRSFNSGPQFIRTSRGLVRVR